VADHIVFLRAGRVLLQGEADELRTSRGMSIDKLFRTVYREEIDNVRETVQA